LANEALPEETGSNKLGSTFGTPRQSSTRPAWIGGLRLGLKTDLVVNGISQSLFATQIPFGRLDADVPKQKLNLFEFSPGLVT
jgi:hypothetical protein